MGNRMSHLSPEVIADLQGDVQFTPEELRDYYKNFLDECPSNRMSIDKETFKKRYAELFPKGDPEKFAEYVFKVIDTDENGRIDFKEFIIALGVHRSESDEDKLKWLFNLFDIDNTNYIRKDELHNMIRAITQLKGDKTTLTAEELTNYFFQKVDKDHDNLLSFEDFVEGLKTCRSLELLMKGASLACEKSLEEISKDSKEN